ncbi:OpgC domain-containing protein [Granulicella sp. S190]|uniref:OpgC domain-containing protein n=1 Tax=Granulicella sp. S190 TaxID=1747226 RepID=UPI00131CDD8F|nr:OpgC domain-containing protein [Granulicella sp. S190]
MQRRPELDALRGLFLVWMTFTHMPTHFSDFVNQPAGFVSSAEGFVFLSAMLVSQVYLRDAMAGVRGVIVKLWRRTLKIYGYHLLMLAFAFTIAAEFAAKTHRPAIYNLINFYLAHPKVAILGGVLLIYCPPLLDILPMYVLFLFLSPIALAVGVRYGWRWVLGGSAALWVGAQFGLRELVHAWVVRVTHLPIPLQQTGAFNLFAWQGVWIAGLWLSAKSAQGEMPLKRIPGYAVAGCGAVCLFFLGVRHNWLGPMLTQESLGIGLDKWQIGPMRVVNLAAFLIICYWFRRYLIRLISVEPFLTLGKASLQVFCAHVFFVFVGLTLLYEDASQLHGTRAYGVLMLTFAGLMWVALRETRLRKEAKAAAVAKIAQSESATAES